MDEMMVGHLSVAAEKCEVINRIKVFLTVLQVNQCVCVVSTHSSEIAVSGTKNTEILMQLVNGHRTFETLSAYPYSQQQQTLWLL